MGLVAEQVEEGKALYSLEATAMLESLLKDDEFGGYDPMRAALRAKPSAYKPVYNRSTALRLLRSEPSGELLPTSLQGQREDGIGRPRGVLHPTGRRPGRAGRGL